MFKFHSMEDKVDMFFSLIIDLVLFKKYFEGILVYFFFETASHLAMQLHRDSQNSIAQFRVKKRHVNNSYILKFLMLK